MIVKICDRCRRRLKVGQECSCTMRIKSSTYRSDEFYRSALWEKARNQCIIDCCGLDLYALFIQRRIEFGSVVHHIMPIEAYPQFRLSRDNLICLSEANHRLIHSLYSEGKFQKTAALLREMKDCFLKGHHSLSP